MAQSKFLLWKSQYVEGECVIRPPVGIEKSYQLKRGISRARDWPTDIVCKMHPEFPHDIQLVDNLYGAGLAVVSARIRDAFAEENVSDVEFLPVTILNHKGRVASEDYYVLNPLSVVECIDIQASGVEWNSIKSDLICGCERLVIRENDVPRGCHVFRPKSWPMCILVGNELTKSLAARNITGLYFVEPLEYTGLT